MRFLLLLASVSLGAVEPVTGYRLADHPAPVIRVLAGWTEPQRTLDLMPEVPGRVAQVLVEEGHPVTTSPVVVLETDLADLAVTSAEAALAQAQAQEVAAASDAARAEGDRAQARRDWQRAQNLGATISEQERDAAALADQRTTHDAAAAAARRQAAAAAVGQATAAFKTAQAQRARHEIGAPTGWIVTRRQVHPGAQVGTGTLLLSLADTSALVIRLRCDEAEVAALRAAGAAIPVRFAGGVTASATLRRIEVGFDPVSKKRLVELALPGSAAPEASGGLAVEVPVAVADPSGGLRIPANLVAWTLEQPTVRLEDGRRLPVLVLRREADAVIVSPTGLPADARLIAP